MRVDIKALVLGSEDYNWLADLVSSNENVNFRKIFIDQLECDTSCSEICEVDWLQEISEELNIEDEDKLWKISDYIIELFKNEKEDCFGYSGEKDFDGAMYVICEGLFLDEEKINSL